MVSGSADRRGPFTGAAVTPAFIISGCRGPRSSCSSGPGDHLSAASALSPCLRRWLTALRSGAGYTSSLPQDRRLPTNLAECSLHAYLGNVVESKEETMSREQSLRNGAGLMVLGAVIFLVYAVVFFFLAFASSGVEIIV